MTPQEAHKTGLPLKEALEKHGNWRKFNSAEYSPPNEMPQNWENDPTQLGKAIGNLTDALIEPGRRRYEVQEDFRRQLEKHKLIGIGYSSPRQISDASQFIPADIWRSGEINFAKSEIENGSLKFESVRIIKPAENNNNPRNKQRANITEIIPSAPNPVGRPSSRDKIIAGYEELKGEGKIDFSKPMTYAYPIVRSFLFFRYKTEKGFQNEAIRNAIRDDFQAEAKKRNTARKL